MKPHGGVRGAWNYILYVHDNDAITYVQLSHLHLASACPGLPLTPRNLTLHGKMKYVSHCNGIH